MAQYLAHYGVKGMKWGKRKANPLSNSDRKHIDDYANNALIEALEYGEGPSDGKDNARRKMRKVQNAKMMASSKKQSTRDAGRAALERIVFKNKKDNAKMYQHQHKMNRDAMRAGGKVVVDKTGRETVYDKNGKQIRRGWSVQKHRNTYK